MFGKRDIGIRNRAIEELGRCQGCGKNVSKKANVCGKPKCARGTVNRWLAKEAKDNE